MRYTFGNFQVDAGNRDAFEVCRSVADLQRVAPLPVLIVGDDGCGKTHLVYSIIHHVRATSAETGLACVTGREFPDAVRALIGDPGPVRRAASAVLLVDELESFGERAGELEALVRLFLEQRHYVVMASSIHPRRIKQLTPGLRALIDGGQIVAIRPRAVAAPEGNASRADGTQHAEVRRVEEELDHVRRQAAAAEESAAQETEQMRRRLDAELARNADLARELESEREAQQAFRREVEKATAEINALRREVDKSQAEVAGLSGLNAEIARLNQQLQRVQSERETADRERLALVGRLREKSALQEEVDALRLELHVAHEQSEEAQREAASLRKQAQGVLQRVEAGRVAFAQAGKGYDQQLRDIETLVEAYCEANGGGNGAVAVSVLATRREELEAALAAAQAEACQALNERDALLSRLSQAESARETLQSELDSARAAIEERSRDLEALRREAAGQVAVALAQAGDLERECARQRGEAEVWRQRALDVAAGLSELRKQFIESSESAVRLAAQLSDEKKADAEGLSEMSGLPPTPQEALPPTP